MIMHRCVGVRYEPIRREISTSGRADGRRRANLTSRQRRRVVIIIIILLLLYGLL